MKYIKKFNESGETIGEKREFKNTTEDIELFFVDYTDEDKNALKITDALIYDGRVVDKTPYMKDISKYRKCKVIELKIDHSDGIITKNDGQCFTNFEFLRNALNDIERFYVVSGEEVNFTINTDYDDLKITFVTVGDDPTEEDTKSTKIDDYLKRISDCIKRKGFKRQKISGNWLDIRFAKKDDYSFAVSDKLHKINSGSLNLDNCQNNIDRELIAIKNEMEVDGLKMKTGGGDQQVVIQILNI